MKEPPAWASGSCVVGGGGLGAVSQQSAYGLPVLGRYGRAHSLTIFFFSSLIPLLSCCLARSALA